MKFINTPTLGRQNSSIEGGQLNFAKSLDDSIGWYIDVYGSTASPDLRIISNNGTSESVRVTVNGSTGSVTAASFVKSGGTSSQYLMADGSVSTSSSFNGGTISSALTITSSAPQLYINHGTSNQIKMAPNGVAAPTFTSYSIGAKIILFDNISASATGHAIGIESGNNWYGSNGGHKFYTGVTNTLTIDSNGAVSTNSSVTADQFISNNNGNGTNFKVGDDAWIGDINAANTIRIKGLQSSTAGYIVFGDSDTTALGRTGTGALTYGGNTVYHAGNFIAGTNYAAASHTHAASDITSGTLATTRGGTGLSSFTSGGAVYATSTSALTTGTLPISAGGTGASDQAGAQNALNVYSKSQTYQQSEVRSLIDYSTWSSGWTSFNTTLTGVTIGTGGSAIKEMYYMKIGKIVHVKARFILGTSGFSVSGTPMFTLPTSYLPISPGFSPVSSVCIMRLSSVSYVGYVGFNGTNAIQVVPINAASTYAQFGSTVSATVPATWAAGDSANLYWSYETA